MGIVSKTTKVKVSRRTFKYYKELGYKFSHIGDEIEVKVEDLTYGSEALVEILCDMCQKTKMIIKYNTYNQAIKNSGSYVCKQCSYEKAAQTNMKKYGVRNTTKLSFVQEKMKQTCMERYGVDNYTKTNEYNEKCKQTCLEKYKFEHSSQCQEVQDKRKQTCVEKYGADHAMQSQTIKDKTKITVQNKYGVDSVLQVPEIRNKIFATNINRYGYKYPVQSEEIQAKIKETIKSNFGVEYAMQSNEVKEKATQSFYKNSSVRTSKQQLYLCHIYQGLLNYPIKYYNVDVCLPDDNIIIEYDGSGHWLGQKFNQFTKDEFDIRESVRSMVIKKSGYKQMHIISCCDKLPSDQVLLRMLTETRDYFFEYPNHSWIEFNIDNSTVRNAENKDGIPYDYGELRKIKDSDIK